MGIFSDIGHALTGTKTDAQNRSDRENEERKADNQLQRRVTALGGDGSAHYDAAAGGFVNSDGQPVSDAQYDQAFGAGKAQQFRDADAVNRAGAPQQAPLAPDLAELTDETLAATGQTQQTPANTTPMAGFQDAGLTNQRRQTTGGATKAAPAVDIGGLNQDVFGANARGPVTANTPTTPTAPTMNTEEIDKLTGGLDTYQNALFDLSQDNTGLSAAEAQLKRATELANIQAGIATDASQRAALGQARSARNRGDRAFLEQQAIGEAGFIGQEAARTKALTEAQARGDIAELRATEEAHDRDFRLQAISEAAKLGLNRAALQVDISKANLDSLTNQLNNDAAFKQLGLQLDQQKAAQVLGFTQAMAALQFQYDKMSVDDQNATDALLMQKYGIDQQTMVALKQLQASREVNWGQVLTAFVGGAGSGISQAGAAKIFSDRRVKKDIKPVAPDELDEFMSALKAETWDYTDERTHGGGRSGRRFGPMAQDLERTRLGKAMVAEDLFGTKTVDSGAVAMATASGLAHVYDRLKGLEEAVK